MRLFIVVLIALNTLLFYLYQQQIIGVAEDGMSSVSIAEKHSLRLVSESKDLATPSVAYCYKIESFENDELFNQFVARISGLSLPIESDRKRVDKIANYWVHVPPLSSLNEAQALRERIVALGVTDVYVIEAGRNKNSVSLGLFSDRKTAQKQLEWFGSKDIIVRLTPRHKAHTVYNVNIGSLSLSQSKKLMETMKREFSSLKYENNSCN